MPVVELPAAVLLCDPEGGAPETFYSVQGSLGGKLRVNAQIARTMDRKTP